VACNEVPLVLQSCTFLFHTGQKFYILNSRKLNAMKIVIIFFLQISDNTNKITFYVTVVNHDFYYVLYNWTICEDMRTLIYPDNENGIMAQKKMLLKNTSHWESNCVL
jgi:hypothetical protein